MILGSGEGVRIIVELMGHNDQKTTMIYLVAGASREVAALGNLGPDATTQAEIDCESQYRPEMNGRKRA